MSIKPCVCDNGRRSVVLIATYEYHAHYVTHQVRCLNCDMYGESQIHSGDAEMNWNNKIDTLLQKTLVVVDPATGLMWESEGSPDRMSWDDAHDYCERLNSSKFCGYTDWRLPTRTELFTLIDDTRFDPCIKVIPGLSCQSSYYWSATPYAYLTTNAWYVYFGNGDVSSNGKASSYYVRCVRTVKEDV